MKMNIFSLETTVNPPLSTPRQLIYFKHIGGGGVLVETEGLLKRGEAYSI